jgi:YegS C-terminal NAD kinase beta sandwich-like domain
MGIKAGASWGEPESGPPDLEVRGSDADLAAVIAARPGALVRYEPAGNADLARSVGVAAGAPQSGVSLPIDAITVDPSGIVVNMVVVGTPPDSLRFTSREAHFFVLLDGRELFRGKATTVVVANGQFLRGLDVVPRGHPGDGLLEVQVYALGRGERAKMRRRLPQGTHLPHPHIASGVGRRVEIRVDKGTVPVTADGLTRRPVRRIRAEITPAALRLLI